MGQHNSLLRTFGHVKVSLLFHRSDTDLNVSILTELTLAELVSKVPLRPTVRHMFFLKRWRTFFLNKIEKKYVNFWCKACAIEPTSCKWDSLVGSQKLVHPDAGAINFHCLA